MLINYVLVYALFEVINYDHALYKGWPYLPERTDSHDGTEKYSSHYREWVDKI